MNKLRTSVLDTLNRLRESERDHSLNEQATKQKYVLPILQSLGWNVFEPQEVEPEAGTEEGPVDYSLKDSGEDKIFIEAKRLSSELDDGKIQQQLLKYTYSKTAKLSVLTNGKTWHFYLPEKRDLDWKDRKFYTIDIVEQNPDDASKIFVELLGRSKVLNGQFINNAEKIHNDRLRKRKVRAAIPEAWNRLASEPDEILVELISEKTAEISGYRPETGEVEKFIARLGSDSISQTGTQKKSSRKDRQTKKRTTNELVPAPEANVTGEKPAAIKLRHYNIQISKWNQLPGEVAQTLINNEHRNPSNLLKLSKFSRHPEFRNVKELEDHELCYEGNLSSNDCVKLAIRVLNCYGIKPEALRISTRG